jgi:signal transduction histidine kinase
MISRKEPFEAGLELFIALLGDLDGFVEGALFECKRGAGYSIRTGSIYCHPGNEPSQDILAKVLSGKERFFGPPGYFEIGFSQTGSRTTRLIGLRLTGGEIGFVGGYAVFASEPRPEVWAALQSICLHGPPFLLQLRKNAVRRDAETQGQSFLSRKGDALRLGADTYWEADDFGVIGHVVKLREGPESSILQALEGKTIPKTDTKSIGASQAFHGLTLEIRAAQGSSTIASLSGQPLPNGGWHGIAQLVPPGQTAPATFRESRLLVDQLQTAHGKDEELRRETEVILDGLRILTSGSASREIFRRLLDLLAPALEFQESVVLQRDWSKHISACAGTAGDLIDADWNGADSLFSIVDVAVSLELPAALVVPSQGRFQSALAVKLRGGSKATVLLCLHERSGFFGARHLGLATRLSLIASQAFMNEEERQKVVDASKLATIGEMAAGIVHEINQPLTAMTLAIGNLQGALETGDAIDIAWLAGKLKKLQSQTGRMSKIIANMKTLSRRSDGALEMFNIDCPINDAIGIVQHKLSQANIVLDVAGERNLKALGNPTEFAQVVLNLVSNAHDAIVAAGGKDNRITILTSVAGLEAIECSVRDTGGGFPEAHIEKAFEPFFTTKAIGQGTGLGLALCRRIVESMGGRSLSAIGPMAPKCVSDLPEARISSTLGQTIST